jgi:hypothetical protein
VRETVDLIDESFATLNQQRIGNKRGSSVPSKPSKRRHTSSLKVNIRTISTITKLFLLESYDVPFNTWYHQNGITKCSCTSINVVLQPTSFIIFLCNHHCVKAELRIMNWYLIIKLLSMYFLLLLLLIL